MINVSYDFISDLTGIEAFINIDNLLCDNNLLSSVNVSSNTALVNLNIGYNQLNSLDVSANVALENLICTSNLLTSLNLSNNTHLTYLNCRENLISDLDISAKPELVEVDCANGIISNLNVSGDTALTKLYCYNNHLGYLNLLSCVSLSKLNCSYGQVTDLLIGSNLMTSFIISNNELSCINNLPPVTTPGAADISNSGLFCVPNLTTYTSGYQLCVANDSINNPYHCSSVISSTNSFNESDVLVTFYPNPSNGIFTFNESNHIVNVEIYNMFGELILSQGSRKEINLLAFPKGVYFAKVNGSYARKLIKE
jgi:hypothetical protein